MIRVVNEDERRYWIFSMDGEELFNRISLDSNYRVHAMENQDDRYVLLEDDRALFLLMLKAAVNELWLKVARMSKLVPEAVKYAEDGMFLKLEVGSNHDDNVVFSLNGFIEQFLKGKVLQQWFERNNVMDEAEKCRREAEIALQNVITVVHFRKKSVGRPINPVF